MAPAELAAHRPSLARQAGRPSRRRAASRARLTWASDGAPNPVRRSMATSGSSRRSTVSSRAGGSRASLEPVARSMRYAALHRLAHEPAGDLVGFAERHAARGEVIGDLGGRHVARRREPRACDRCAKLAVASAPVSASSETRHRVDRVEDRRLVLLQVAVVAERQPLLEREQARRDRRSRAPLLPRTSSATSGFFFCGIIDEPVANASSSSTKPNSCARPEHDLFADAREVHRA